jgi:hypothetical protein
MRLKERTRWASARLAPAPPVSLVLAVLVLLALWALHRSLSLDSGLDALLLGLLTGVSVAGAVWNINAAMVLLPPGRGHVMRSVVPAFAFGLGTFAGGAVVMATMALVGVALTPVPEPVRTGTLLASALVLLVVELLTQGRVLPKVGEIIPSSRFRRGVGRGMLAFAFELGVGFRTLVPHSAPYVLIAVLLLLGKGLPWALFAAAGWALGRTASIVAWMVLNARMPSMSDATRQLVNDWTNRFNSVLAILALSASITACAWVAAVALV